MSGVTVKAEEILRDNFAPWVLDLGLVVEEVGDGTAVLRLPWSERLAREGGALSGQALMAAADTAVVIAVSGAKGGFVPMTTVQLSTSFQRPVVGKDVLVGVEVTKLGRTLAFAEIDMTVDSATVARASAVYAIIG
ncbi:PaaI family thioesterase [Actinomadura sp. 6K520]|nr:PaaI family thioesterase [Actinomadura sp. 6K520]